MSKHTPGPWKIETVLTSCGRCHKIGPFNACIYDDDTSLNKFGSVALIANARLIAAAPDLLSELEFMVEQYELLTDDVATTARAAIAKARGEK